MCPTSARVTEAFDARNFNFLVHAVCPPLCTTDDPMDKEKVYLTIRNALDQAAEEGASSIAFPCVFPGLPLEYGSEEILNVFATWISDSPYALQIDEIKVVCPTDAEFNSFVTAARKLYARANVAAPKAIQPRVVLPAGYRAQMLRMNGHSSDFRHPTEPSASTSSSSNQNGSPVKLELSAKLAPTILVIDDENGLKRQYRLTNKSRDGRKLYFRCSRCDTLIKKDGNKIRAKLTLQDGVVVGERYPKHHPQCTPKSQEDVFVQQVDRTSRREVREGLLMPQEAYEKAVHRVVTGSMQDPEISEAAEKFPEWNRLRQQYFRIRKTALRKHRADGQKSPDGEEGSLDYEHAIPKRPRRRSTAKVEFSESHEVVPMRLAKNEAVEDVEIDVVAEEEFQETVVDVVDESGQTQHSINEAHALRQTAAYHEYVPMDKRDASNAIN
ncbi:hypothetical protein AAVH_00618 [Aphelenchoides avenae]|nr:hypothetical protein AAVH_00618 [Aphelenchus avenae]